MNMKTINFKGLLEVLNEKELKKVVAGGPYDDEDEGGEWSDPCSTTVCNSDPCTNINGASGQCMVMIFGYCRCTTC